ncbi:hypothetical protein [Nannocystis bainbridge]|uniref:Uncharacterized protein n=1 Tax=Nannocystis bainbridge TaxID=2995303 RepID=A0ABT5DR22_9BACT|nr:hypothetical protein [Nannocystis bainbridge]MDC0716001.1 hypothetical protein [Nannocystis bainbridge]
MPPARATWMIGPAWDVAALAFGWLPFYLWLVIGLGLGAQAFGGAPLAKPQLEEATALAVLAALAISYVHRHYTFVVVYGDRDVFTQRARAYWLAPTLIVAIVALARATSGLAPATVAGIKLSPWQIALFVTGAWNIWHTLQQRYGMLRIYAGKLGGGTERPEQARRDRALIWLATACVAVALPLLRPQLLGGHVNARKLGRLLAPLAGAWWAWALLLAVVGAFAWVLLRWLAHELRAPATPGQRAPRLAMMASTLLLFAVFLIHGPVVGYLCFGTAHAVEYMAFVHHFGTKKYGRGERRGAAARVLGDARLAVPALAGGLLLVFWLIQGQRRTDVYLVYYTATSWLHFLYDGWIWKVRRPELARTLELGAHPPASA